MRRLYPALLAFALASCGKPPELPPAPPPSIWPPLPDGGADGGQRDAGVKDGGAIDAGFVSVQVEQWCETFALADCARRVRCMTLEPSRFAECRQRLRNDCDQSAYTAAVAHGRVQYLSGEAAKCLNAYFEGACRGRPAACDVVFQGLVPPDGGACILDLECRSDGFCYGGYQQCPRRCRPWLELGMSCSPWSSDQRCNPADAACKNDGGSYYCTPRRGLNEPCGQHDDCASDLACGGGTCIQPTARLGEGCGVHPGGYPHCEPGVAFCRQAYAPPGTTPPPGTCQLLAGMGAPCVYSGCKDGLRCTSAYQTGVCIERGMVGEVCNYTSDCKEELFCDPRDSHCEPLPADGGDCSYNAGGSDFRCAAGYVCSGYPTYTCVRIKANGERCAQDSECLSRVCLTGLLPDGGYGRHCAAPCGDRYDGG